MAKESSPVTGMRGRADISASVSEGTSVVVAPVALVKTPLAVLLGRSSAVVVADSETVNPSIDEN
jgi:hypothetical protein